MTFEIGTDGISGLVVGFDGSGPSRDALAFGMGVARRNHADLVVVYVLSHVTDVLAAMDPYACSQHLLANNEAVESLRREVEGLMAERVVTGTFVVAEGDPAAAVEQVAADMHLDAILVGRSRARRRHVVGSVPARLLRLAERPVAVVP